MTAKMVYLTAGVLVAISATIAATYTITLNTAVAQCSIGTSNQADVAMKNFLAGPPVPMQGGKKY